MSPTSNIITWTEGGREREGGGRGGGEREKGGRGGKVRMCQNHQSIIRSFEQGEKFH